jgi:hypothetical protein
VRTAALTVTVPHPLSAELLGASPMPMKSTWLTVEDEITVAMAIFAGQLHA